MDPILTLNEIGLRDMPRVGREAAALGELTAMGVPVSAAFVVPTTSCAEYFSQPGARSALGMEDSISREELKARLLAIPLPKILERSLRSAYRALSGPRDVFVLISADGGDAIKALGVEEVLYSVKRLWVDRLAQKPLPILVRRVESSDLGGRLLTSDPYSDRTEIAVVEVDYDDGKEKLLFDKKAGELVKRLAVGAVAKPVPLEQTVPIALWAAKVEEALGGPHTLGWIRCQGDVSFTRVEPLHVRRRVPAATRLWVRVGSKMDTVPSEAEGLVATSSGQAVSLAEAFPNKPVLLELGAVNESELGVIRRSRHKDGRRNLHLLLPAVRTVEGLRGVKRAVAGEGLHRGPHLKFYLRLVFPANIVLLKRFLEVGIDGAVFDAPSLARYFLGTQNPAEASDSVLWAVRTARDVCRASGIKFLYYGERLEGDLVNELLRRGVDCLVVDVEREEELLSVLSCVEREMLGHA